LVGAHGRDVSRPLFSSQQRETGGVIRYLMGIMPHNAKEGTD
jgi:hypothetical protein